MKLVFEQEGTTTYVVAFNQELDGYLHQELYYADIEDLGGKVILAWNSNYSNKIPFNTVEDAKVFAQKNYHKHKPHSQGTKTYLGDE
jgi:hypothetical protein